MIFGKSAKTSKRVCWECGRPYPANPSTHSASTQFFCGDRCKKKADWRKHKELGEKMFQAGLKVRIGGSND